MELGTNIDPRLPLTAADLGPLQWARTVLLRWGLPMTQGWVDECHARGVKVLGVIARESMAPRPGKRAGRWDYAIHDLARQSGELDALQVGNEPDISSPSSWTIPPKDLDYLIRMARKEFPRTKLVLAGMASGDPSYLDRLQFLQLVDAIAVHPYGQRAYNYPDPGWGFGNVEDLIASYRRFNKPIWVTEFGGPSRDFDSEHQRAEYHSSMVRALASCGVRVATQFCFSDLMVPGFGMLTAGGDPTETYAAIMGAKG